MSLMCEGRFYHTYEISSNCLLYFSPLVQLATAVSVFSCVHMVVLPYFLLSRRWLDFLPLPWGNTTLITVPRYDPPVALIE